VAGGYRSSRHVPQPAVSAADSALGLHAAVQFPRGGPAAHRPRELPAAREPRLPRDRARFLRHRQELLPAADQHEPAHAHAHTHRARIPEVRSERHPRTRYQDRILSTCTAWHESQTLPLPLFRCVIPSIHQSRLFPRFKLSGSYTGNLLMATYSKGKAEERDAEAGRVFGCAAQSFGENVSEAEVHQQTRQEEAGHETRPERLS
ncbi:Uncharacterized protein DAT39_006231, partial [Clarias magur]